MDSLLEFLQIFRKDLLLEYCQHCLALAVAFHFLFVCFFIVSYDEFSFIIINLICCVYVVNFSMLSDEYFLHQYFEDRFLL